MKRLQGKNGQRGEVLISVKKELQGRVGKLAGNIEKKSPSKEAQKGNAFKKKV